MPKRPSEAHSRPGASKKTKSTHRRTINIDIRCQLLRIEELTNHKPFVILIHSAFYDTSKEPKFQFIEKRFNKHYVGNRYERMAELKNEITKLKSLATKKSTGVVSLFYHPVLTAFSNDSLFLTYDGDIDLFDACKKGQFKILLDAQRKEVTNQLSQALMCLFDNDVVHGDLKPENILVRIVNQSIRLRICDFGSSRHSSQLGDEFHGGTIAYRAPEVLLESKLYFASDIWSLALVFFFLDNKAKDLFSFKDHNEEKERFAGFMRSSSSYEKHLNDKLLTKSTENTIFARKMLSLKPEDRPTHSNVAEHFSLA